MEKTELIDQEINKLESEIERLKDLKVNVSGGTVKECNDCGTLNSHWYPSGHWCCAFC